MNRERERETEKKGKAKRVRGVKEKKEKKVRRCGAPQEDNETLKIKGETYQKQGPSTCILYMYLSIMCTLTQTAFDARVFN